MSELCREFGISRKPSYKFYQRYRDEEAYALCDRALVEEIVEGF